MRRVERGELRRNLDRHLDRVKAGETVEVTERGELIALLIPPGPALTARDRLVASGRLLPAAGPLQFPHRVVVGHSSFDVLDALRDDR